MLAKRIIPCLDVKAGRVVKGVNFVNLTDAGDPVACAEAYDRAGADELTFLDITASSDARRIMLDTVRAVARAVYIPFTVGGGIQSIQDAPLHGNADDRQGGVGGKGTGQMGRPIPRSWPRPRASSAPSAWSWPSTPSGTAASSRSIRTAAGAPPAWTPWPGPSAPWPWARGRSC